MVTFESPLNKSDMLPLAFSSSARWSGLDNLMNSWWIIREGEYPVYPGVLNPHGGNDTVRHRVTEAERSQTWTHMDALILSVLDKACF